MRFFSKFRKFIEVFDFFGQEFKLKINKKTKIKTLPGGLMTIIIIIITFTCLYKIANEFILSEKSKIFQNEGFFKRNEFPIFYGEDYKIKTIIFGYPEWLDKIQKLRVTKEINSKRLEDNLNKCDINFLTVQNLNFKGEDSLVFYCLDLNQYKLGGKNNFIGIQNNEAFFNLDISFVSNMKYSQDDLIINRNKNNAEFFIWSPTVSYNSENKIYLENIYKMDKFSFSKNKISILESEIKAYFSEPIGKQTLGKENLLDLGINKFSFTTEENSDSYNFYPDFNLKLKFYISQKYKIFREIKKTSYEMISNFGGFFYLIFLAFHFLNNIMNFYYIDKSIIDNFFDFYEPIHQSSFIQETSKCKLLSEKQFIPKRDSKINMSEVKILSQTNLNFEEINLKSIKESNIFFKIKLEKNEIKRKYSSDPMIENINNSEGLELRKLKIKTLTNTDQNKIMESNIKNIQNLMTLNKLKKFKQEKQKEIEINKNKNNINFFNYRLCCKFCRKSDSTNNYIRVASKLIKNFTNFDFILKKILENEIFKSFLLDRNQQLSLTNFKKINRSNIFQYHNKDKDSHKNFTELLNNNSNFMQFLNCSILMSSSEKDLFTTNYFVDKIRSNENMNNFDENLFNHLESDLKENIQINSLDDNFKF